MDALGLENRAFIENTGDELWPSNGAPSSTGWSTGLFYLNEHLVQVTGTMRPKKNAQTKPSTTSVLQPKCYRTYNEVSSLSAVKLKQLCGQYNIDPTLPKKAKIVFISQTLGISTTGSTNNNSVNHFRKTFDSLTSKQIEELEQLKTKILYCMPAAEWTTDITKLPEINDVSVKRYLLDNNILDKSSARTYKLSRPYQLRNNVHSIKYCENEESKQKSRHSVSRSPQTFAKAYSELKPHTPPTSDLLMAMEGSTSTIVFWRNTEKHAAARRIWIRRLSFLCRHRGLTEFNLDMSEKCEEKK
ncbi:hypothetical protein MAR_015873 [Mya arenaria]|uniref:Uncharacterized protein n=1 Tax=Mya arenaria TaxID=6604 RepID=A0ABY7FKN1_MYAAR|nr:hypothetical protein MAR_015873 [Mya arenaria]